MKRVLSFVLIIAIICTFIVPSFAASPSVSVKTSSVAIAGETITVSVNLSANSGLAGLQFAVNFNSAEFQLVSGSAQTSSLFTALPVEKTNSIEFSGVSVNPVNSGGAVLTFKLKVIKTGGTISIRIIDAINGDNQTVSVSSSSATVKCSHANAKWVVTKKATCTEKGSETRECSCGDKATREITLANHNFGDWKVVTEANETTKGLKERVCKDCGKKETKEIGKIVANDSTTVTETETETETQSETQTETTTIPQVDDTTPNNNAKPVVIGAIFFVVGIAVGIGVTLLIFKRKAKEEE